MRGSNYLVILRLVNCSYGVKHIHYFVGFGAAAAYPIALLIPNSLTITSNMSDLIEGSFI